MFHEHVVAHYDEIASSIRKELEDARKMLCSAHQGCSNQISRVAERFALAIIAGRLACAWGVFPFTADVAEKSVKACFENWITQRGGIAAHEDIEAVRLVKNFIYSNRLSRFERLDVFTDELKPQQPVLRDVVGFADVAANEYYFYKDAFEKTVLKGLNARKACKALFSAKLLCRDDRPSGNTVRKHGIYCYKIVLPYVPDDSTADETDDTMNNLPYAF